jgi:hypothetical protein
MLRYKFPTVIALNQVVDTLFSPVRTRNYAVVITCQRVLVVGFQIDNLDYSELQK